VLVPILYLGVSVELGLRIDLLVERQVVIELKSVEKLIPIFESQTLTYLKLSKKRLGFLVNFNVVYIKEGIKRIIL
jgi:GxxExxY protein